MIGKNLAKLRKNLGLGQNEFALKLGINSRAYVNYEREERKLPYEILLKLYSDLNVNLNWFVSGEGEMFNRKPFEQVEDQLTQKVESILKKRGLI